MLDFFNKPKSGDHWDPTDLWEALNSREHPVVHQSWPNDADGDFFSLLKSEDEERAEQLERAYRFLERFQMVPIVAVVGLINSGKSSLTSSFLTKRSRDLVLRGVGSKEGTQRFSLWFPSDWKQDPEFYDQLLLLVEETFGVAPEVLSDDFDEAREQQNHEESLGRPLLAADENLNELGIALLDCPDIQRPQKGDDKGRNTRLEAVARAAEICAGVIIVATRTQMEIRDLQAIIDRMPEAQRIYAINMLRFENAADVLAEMKTHLPMVPSTLCYAAYDFQAHGYADFTPSWDPVLALTPEERWKSGSPCFFEIGADEGANAPTGVTAERSLLQLAKRISPEALQRKRQVELQQGFIDQIKQGLEYTKEQVEAANIEIDAGVDDVYVACKEIAYKDGQLRIKMNREIVASLEQSFDRTASFHYKIFLVPQRKFLKACSKAWQFGGGSVRKLWAKKKELEEKLDIGSDVGPNAIGLQEIQQMLALWSGAHSQYRRPDDWEDEAKVILKRYIEEDKTNLSDDEWDALTRPLWKQVPAKARLKIFGSMFLMLGSLILAFHDGGVSFLTVKAMDLLGGIGLLTSLGVGLQGADDFQKSLEEKIGMQQVSNLHGITCDVLGIPREPFDETAPRPTVETRLDETGMGIVECAWKRREWLTKNVKALVKQLNAG